MIFGDKKSSFEGAFYVHFSFNFFIFCYIYYKENQLVSLVEGG